MTLQKNITVLAYKNPKEISLLSSELKKEAADFLKRNLLVAQVKDKKRKGICCKQCLYAYLHEKAKEKGLPEIALALEQKLGQIGHEGYYLDEEQLKRVNLLN